jgi:Holliday junction resolvase-like predicted endonuclease
MYNKLRARFADVSWINENGELGCPYDITYVDKGVKVFVDVKTTRAQELAEAVSLTRNEQQFLIKNRDCYKIAAVSIGQHPFKYAYIDDPLIALNEKQLHDEFSKIEAEWKEISSRQSGSELHRQQFQNTEIGLYLLEMIQNQSCKR